MLKKLVSVNHGSNLEIDLLIQVGQNLSHAVLSSEKNRYYAIQFVICRVNNYELSIIKRLWSLTSCDAIASNDTVTQTCHDYT